MDSEYTNYWIVSVVDSISVTSMPINEFIIYRAKHKYSCRQMVIVCDKNIPGNVDLPDEVNFQLVGRDEKKIKSVIKEVELEADQKGLKVVYHIHHQKAGLLFYKATLGLGIRKKILFTVHSTYKDRNLKYKVSSAISVLIAHKANCVSKAAFNDYSYLIRKMKGRNFVVISNGVDFARVDNSLDKVENNFESRKRKMVCVGRMIPIKNHKFLVSILNKLPNCSLVLIGSEDKKQTIRKFVEKNNLSHRVEFTGLIGRDRVFEKLGECGLYVSASRIEGMPLSVLEAMSAGLISVLSYIGPHKEIKSQCESTIVLPLDENIWIREISRLMSLSEIEFRMLSEKIQTEVRQKYSLDTMHKQYFKLYESMFN